MLSSKSDRDSGNSSKTEDIGTSIILMAMLVDARPRSHNNVELRVLDDPCQFKEHLAVVAARKFGLMLNCDIRTPDPEDRMVEAREEKFVIFRDTLKVKFRWPPASLFCQFLGQALHVPKATSPRCMKDTLIFFIACRFLGITSYPDLCRMMFELKQLPTFTCFAYILTRKGFRIPTMPSLLKGWKDMWFYVLARDVDRGGVSRTLSIFVRVRRISSHQRERQTNAGGFGSPGAKHEGHPRGRSVRPLGYKRRQGQALFFKFLTLSHHFYGHSNPLFISAEMSFDPSALWMFVHAKEKAPQPSASTKGKKRPKVLRPEQPLRGPRESSQDRAYFQTRPPVSTSPPHCQQSSSPWVLPP